MKKIILVLFLGLSSTQFFSCSKKTVELSYAAQLQKDEAAIDTYLALHNISAIKDSSGIRYTVNILGTGAKPTVNGNVSVSYSASLLSNSAPFDSSTGAVYPLSGLISAWIIMLPKLPKGTKFTMYVPSGLAYGQAGVSSVPGNAIVVFDITIFDDDAQLIHDVAAIDAYLDTIDAQNVIKDPSGLRYTVTTLGVQSKPISTSTVTVTYTGKLLTTKQVFDTSGSTPVSFALADVIAGWRIALEEIPVGSVVTLYIPSGLAYGPSTESTSTGTIPANSSLIFDISLMSTQ